MVNSDEELEPEKCPPCQDGKYKCGNGRCIWQVDVCDGADQCGDNSDEFENPEDCPKCSDNEFSCERGRCLGADRVCDSKSEKTVVMKF